MTMSIKKEIEVKEKLIACPFCKRVPKVYERSYFGAPLWKWFSKYIAFCCAETGRMSCHIETLEEFIKQWNNGDYLKGPKGIYIVKNKD